MLLADPQLQLALAALTSLLCGAGLSYWQAQKAQRALEAELIEQRCLNDEYLQETQRLDQRCQEQQQQLAACEHTRTELALSQQALSHQQAQNQQQHRQLSEQQNELATFHKRSEAQAELRARFDEQHEQLQHAHQELSQLREQLQNKEQQLNTLSQKAAQLDAQQLEKTEALKRQQALFEQQKETLKAEFEQLAGKIFDARGQKLDEQNQQQLSHLLSPLRQQLSSFHKEVRDIHHRDTQQQSQLSAELHQLKELNQKITTEAHELATALKGQKKMQGNWGELLLENVLDRAGLMNGQDYQREVSLTNEDGQRQRPDAIVYLPENKHLIIDAKVSLNAYTRFINSENEVERKTALSAHIDAFAARIDELSERNYFELPGLNSPELVFMFVPIESAFVAAIQADERLFQRALEKNVLVATPTTLLTSLNIVRQLWRFEDQNRHSAELANKAAKIYDKLRGFVGSMEGLGKQLDNAQQSYQKALGQLCSGRGNLIKQASEFSQLGVAVKQELPEHLQERAALELQTPPETR